MFLFTPICQFAIHSYTVGKSGLIPFFLMCCIAIGSNAFAQDGGKWYTEQFSGATPEARHESAFVALGDQFYLLGGRGVRTIQVYNPKTNTWKNTQTSTSNINHFQAIAYDGKIYLVCAFTGNYPDESPLANILIYDPTSDQLTTGPLIPENRRRGSAGTVVYHNKIYVVGGNRNGHSAYLKDGVTPANVSWFDEFDPATGIWKTLPDAPHARDHFAAVVVGDQLFIAGGRRSKFGTPESTFKDTEGAVDVYDFSAGKWLSGDNVPADIPTKRAGTSTVVLGDEIVVMGGEINYNPPSNLALNTVEALNVNTGTWRTLAPMQLGRHATQAIVYDGDVYIAAGSRTKGNNEITADQNFIEVYSTDGAPQDSSAGPAFPEWTKVGDAPEPRVESPAVVYNGELYVFNGFQFSYDIENSNVKYNPRTNTWTKLATMPSQPDGKPWAVTHTSIVLVGDTVWIIGGRVGNVPGPPTDRVWWYKISEDKWMPGPTLPFKSAGSGAGRLGNKIHYIGGLDEQAQCDREFHLVYDLNNPTAGWQDSTATVGFPEFRNHFGTAVLEGKLYAIGGQHAHDGCQMGLDVKLVHVYDPITNSWTRLNDFPYEESHIEPGTFAIDGKIYVVGGQLRGRHVRVYDPTTDTWTRIRELDLPEALLAPVARIFGDTLVSVFGGAPGTSNPVSYTIMHTIDRTPLLQLGFNPKELRVQLRQGETKSIETILYSQTGKANYTLSSNLPSWLTVNKSSGIAAYSDEAITLRFNTSTLTPGTYTYQLVSSAPNYTSGTIQITLQVLNNNTPQNYWIEAECGNLGNVWTAHKDTVAASVGYIIVRQKGVNSLSVPPADVASNKAIYNIDIAQAGNYRFFARVRAPNANDDSFWVRINGGAWISWSEGMQTGSIFDWREVPGSPFNFVQGNNVIEFAYRENGTALDKLYLTNSNMIPTGKGEPVPECAHTPFYAPNEVAYELDSNFNTKRLILFPNPANGNVLLKADFLDANVPFQADVMDTQGRVLKTQQWGTFNLGAVYALDIASLHKGAYIVRITQGSIQFTAQLIIE